jgi:chloramphenicol O-acetyltransferase
MLHKNLIHLPLTILQKDFVKDLQKEFAKTKQCGASVVQNVKNKEITHAYLVSNIYWLKF